MVMLQQLLWKSVFWEFRKEYLKFSPNTYLVTKYFAILHFFDSIYVDKMILHRELKNYQKSPKSYTFFKMINHLFEKTLIIQKQYLI